MHFDSFRKAVSVALAIVLVAQVAVAPTLADDSIEDQLGEAACKVGSTAFGPWAWASPDCTVSYGGVDGATAEEVHYNIYGQAAFMDDSREQWTVEKESRIAQTRQLALAQAKWKVIEELNNGSSKAEAYSVANSEINEMFATMQKSMYVSQNRQIQQLKVIDQTVQGTEDLGTDENSDLYLEVQLSDGVDLSSNQTLQFDNHTTSLWDGSTVNVTTAQLGYTIDQYEGETTVDTYELAWYNGGIDTSASYSAENVRDEGRSKLSVHHPDNPDRDAVDQEFEYATHYRDWKFALEDLSEQRDSALDEVDTLVDSIYANYEAGDVSVSDAQGPLERSLTAGSDYTETGSSAYLLQSAASMGMSVPDGASMAVETDHDNDGSAEVREGSIYAPSGTFDGSLQVGETYDPADLSHNVTFVWAPEDSDEPAEEYLLDEEFTVRNAWNPQNESETYSTVDYSSNDFATTDTDDLNAQIANLTQQMDDLEDEHRQSSSLFGDLGGSGAVVENLLAGTSIGLAIVALLGILALVVLLRIYTP